MFAIQDLYVIDFIVSFGVFVQKLILLHKIRQLLKLLQAFRIVLGFIDQLKYDLLQVLVQCFTSYLVRQFH